MSINLILGDCLEKMKDIPDKSIDMVLTSPPYDDLRSYNNTLVWSFDIFKLIANELKRVIKEGGVIVWVINDATIDGTETGTSFRQALYFKEIGFNLHDTMIWEKSSSPFMSRNRYRGKFEYMFVISNGKPKVSNLIKDRENKHRISTGITERLKCGRLKPRKDVTLDKLGYRFNIWKISEVKNNKTGHPAVFPLSLAGDHIRTWTNEHHIVLDPFMGSGTTGLACKNLNRNFIGIEKDEAYFNIAKQRI